MKPLWALAGVALLATAGTVGAVLVASPGGEEEVVQQVETATAAASASPSAIVTPSASPTQSSSPTPVSASAATLAYTDATYGYSFEYPATWDLSPGKGPGGVTTLASYDPETVPSEAAVRPIPTAEIKAEFLVLGNPNGLSAQAWIEQSRDASGPVEVISRSAVMISDEEGIAETANLAEGSATQYFIPHQENMFLIAKYPADSALSSEFDAVLSTFKFSPTP